MKASFSRITLVVAAICCVLFPSGAAAQYPNCVFCMYGSQAACDDSCERSYPGGKDLTDCYICCNACISEDPPHDGIENQCDSNGCSDPLLIDLGLNGLDLTDGAGGVWFDIDGDGTTEPIAWTTGAAGDAFLAFDRDQNGRIDGARELFGDATPQYRSDGPNGFRALRDWDRAGLGGNEDGLIGPADAIWPRLLLWVDRSHDGISQPDELSAVAASAVTGIQLDYRESRRRDKDGNQYTYRSTALLTGGRHTAVFDVFFTSAP